MRAAGGIWSERWLSAIAPSRLAASPGGDERTPGRLCTPCSVRAVAAAAPRRARLPGPIRSRNRGTIASCQSQIRIGSGSPAIAAPSAVTKTHSSPT